MNLSCCVWALSGDDEEILSQLTDLGFQQFDIQPKHFSQPQSRHYLQQENIRLGSMAASFAIPEDCTLSSADKSEADAAFAAVENALELASDLGIDTAYVVPDIDDSADAIQRYGEAVTALAERGSSLGTKLCIEHFPGRALPTIAETLDFIREIGHPNLYLLYDIGHAQISKEDIPASIEAAGPLLGYFHLDDNDGEGDLHWALLDGVMTESSLQSGLDALAHIGYNGPTSLELHWELPDPLDALRRSLEILQKLQ
ncbi:MAG: sugar phosphate isomerase/epimerase family protein [Chloroflexota bacterium]